MRLIGEVSKEKSEPLEGGASEIGKQKDNFRLEQIMPQNV